MKIGIITDVHNNLPALNAVLEVFQSVGVQQILCCGDIIGIGPYPEETIRRLVSLDNLTAVRGNHDRYLSDGMPDAFPNDEHMDREEMLHHRWEHARLSPESAAFLNSLPLQAELFAEGRRICILHYCMDGEGRYVNYTPHPTGEELSRMFSDVDAEIILYGHDHGRTILEHAGRWYINVGSLGCPARQKNIARAGILTLSEDRIAIEPVDIPYDAAAVVREIDRLNYPSAGEIKKYFYGIE